MGFISREGFVEDRSVRSNVSSEGKRVKRKIMIVAVSIVVLTSLALGTIALHSQPHVVVEKYRSTATHVVINEVYYDVPSGYAEPQCEWIELYNPTNAEVDLSGWKLTDGYIENKSYEGIWTFPSGAKIPAGGYILVVNDATYKNDFSKLFPGVTPDFDTNSSNDIPTLSVSGALIMANTGDDIHLYDSSNTQVDIMWYGNGGDHGSLNAAPRVASGHSLARYYNAEDTGNPSKDFYDESKPTPRTRNTLEVPELSFIIPILLIVFFLVCRRRR